jgi:hypothetical protein
MNVFMVKYKYLILNQYEIFCVKDRLSGTESDYPFPPVYIFARSTCAPMHL